VSEWREIKLGDLVARGVAEIRTGPFGTQLRASDYSSEGVPVINVRNLGYGTVRTAEIERVGFDVQERLRGHLLAQGDVVFGRKGAVDRHILVTQKEAGWMQGSDCIRMRLLEGSPISPAFLSKTLLTPSHKAWMEAQASHGATMASLNQAIIGRISVSVPELPRQRRIAAVLAAFDELIEINERRIELLEDLARSLYREWFARFRFPGHEAVEFVDSELGPIPERWEALRLGEIAQLRYGRSLPATKRRPGPFAVVSSAGVVGEHDDALVEGPGIVLGRKGNVGSVWWLDDDFFPIDTTYYVTSDLPLGFLYWQLSDLQFDNSHAAVPGLSRDHANSLLVIRPDQATVRRFGEHHMRVFNAIAVLSAQSEALIATRDLLLPRLVTGRLEISDIDLGALLPAEAA
jgi:type I restriction enzyme S subunit